LILAFTQFGQLINQNYWGTILSVHTGKVVAVETDFNYVQQVPGLDLSESTGYRDMTVFVTF
jgi:hypothetical protein